MADKKNIVDDVLSKGIFGRVATKYTSGVNKEKVDIVKESIEELPPVVKQPEPETEPVAVAVEKKVTAKPVKIDPVKNVYNKGAFRDIASKFVKGTLIKMIDPNKEVKITENKESLNHTTNTEEVQEVQEVQEVFESNEEKNISATIDYVEKMLEGSSTITSPVYFNKDVPVTPTSVQEYINVSTQKEIIEATMDLADDTNMSVDAKLKALERKMMTMAANMAGGGSNGGLSKGLRKQIVTNASDIATLSADVGEFSQVTTNQRDQYQGYIALLTPVYFSGSATTFEIPLSSTNTWVDVELEIDPAGAFDHRVTSMKTAQLSGYTGTGNFGDPIIFLLEGLELTSSADIRVSMSFDPDDDGGRLDSRLNFFRHGGISLSATNFHIEASSLAMESGADIDYSYLPDIKFFIGDTIDTNGPGDAGRVCFQIRSDVPGTVTMNEISMFIQK